MGRYPDSVLITKNWTLRQIYTCLWYLETKNKAALKEEGAEMVDLNAIVRFVNDGEASVAKFHKLKKSPEVLFLEAIVPDYEKPAGDSLNEEREYLDFLAMIVNELCETVDGHKRTKASLRGQLLK